MILAQTIVEGNFFRSEFTQYHKGYEVENGMMNTIGQFGVVSYANGNIIKGLNVNVLNPIVESIALTSALTKINANVYDWQDINRENRIREEEDRPTYSSYPKGKMLIVPGVTTSA
jgi:hypothetical protein